MENQWTGHKYSNIISLLSLTRNNTGDVLLVKIPTFVSFLDQLPQDVLETILSRTPDTPPPLESPEWVDWFKTICIQFKIPRDKFIEKAKVDKGDLSKFEANKKKFSAKIKIRLLNVIHEETGIIYDHSISP